jgi:hypothetical protein
VSPVFPFIIHSVIRVTVSISAILVSHHAWLPSFINPIIYCLRRSWNVFMCITQWILFLVHDNTLLSARQSLLIWPCHHSILLAWIYGIHTQEWVWLITQSLLQWHKSPALSVSWYHIHGINLTQNKVLSLEPLPLWAIPILIHNINPSRMHLLVSLL